MSLGVEHIIFQQITCLVSIDGESKKPKNFIYKREYKDAYIESEDEVP